MAKKSVKRKIKDINISVEQANKCYEAGKRLGEVESGLGSHKGHLETQHHAINRLDKDIKMLKLRSYKNYRFYTDGDHITVQKRNWLGIWVWYGGLGMWTVSPAYRHRFYSVESVLNFVKKQANKDTWDLLR